MIGKVLLAALLAGIAAGLVMGAIQHVRLTPLIVAAEVFEGAARDNAMRTLSTYVTSAMAGAAFAAIMAGLSLLTGLAMTRANGVIWGLCGFLAVTLAPAAGLPPELPGMPVGDLRASQIWWAGTIVATGFGIYLIAARAELWAVAAAVILIALPHVIGAPTASSQVSAVAPGLAAAFAANAIAAGAVFWCLIGLFLGISMERVAK